jgi:hypothetical protein
MLEVGNTRSGCQNSLVLVRALFLAERQPCSHMERRERGRKYELWYLLLEGH